MENLTTEQRRKHIKSLRRMLKIKKYDNGKPIPVSLLYNMRVMLSIMHKDCSN